MAKLKVFVWSDGFHAFTVAASSRPKALQAWGFNRDLFKEGAAQEDPDAPDAEAALKAPGTVIERGLSVDIGSVKLTKAAKPDKAVAVRKARLASLKSELGELDLRYEAERAALDERIAELEAARADLGQRHAAARQKIEARIEKARG
jgi:hypothetical protein